jgi:LruC domain-containing protein
MSIDNPASHAVIIQSDLVADSLLMGWEDLYRNSSGCDNDFNDLVVQLTATPPEIIEIIATTNDLPILDGDRDGDGLADAVDDFPDDPGKAIDNKYPSGSEHFTIAFEDMFPEVGDADYNDLVTIGSFHEHLNAAGHVVELRGQLQIITRGAARDSAFHLRIENAPSGSWTVDRTDWHELPSGSDRGVHSDGALDLVLFPDAKAALPPFNTAEGAALERGSKVEFTYVPDDPTQAQTMAQAPYDPYLVLLSSGYDIHTLGHDPIPGSSNPPVAEGFLDANGYPWGLIFPEPWEPPAERVHIEEAYDDFSAWKTSSGTTKKTWYRGGRRRVVTIPPELLLPPL